MFAGLNTLSDFLTKFIEWEREFIVYLKNMFLMRLTREQKNALARATKCYLFLYQFVPEKLMFNKICNHKF